MEKEGLLYLIVSKFADEIDLHPARVTNTEMGYIFEELIRKFSEMSNETAGEHFTPREVIRLMVAVLFDPDMDKISSPSFMAKLYDPAAEFRVIIVIEANSQVNTRALELLPKFKIKKMNRWCAV